MVAPIQEILESPSEAVLLAPRKAGPQNILLVENEAGVRELLASVLERWGYQTIVTRGAYEALRYNLLFSGELDLLLTDIVMPELNGVELAREITAARPDIKLLYISGYAAYAVLYCGLSVDAPLLQKPLRLSLLKRTIEGLLQP